MESISEGTPVYQEEYDEEISSQRDVCGRTWDHICSNSCTVIERSTSHVGENTIKSTNTQYEPLAHRNVSLDVSDADAPDCFSDTEEEKTPEIEVESLKEALREVKNDTLLYHITSAPDSLRTHGFDTKYKTPGATDRYEFFDPTAEQSHYFYERSLGKNIGLESLNSSTRQRIISLKQRDINVLLNPVKGALINRYGYDMETLKKDSAMEVLRVYVSKQAKQDYFLNDKKDNRAIRTERDIPATQILPFRFEANKQNIQDILVGELEEKGFQQKNVNKFLNENPAILDEILYESEDEDEQMINNFIISHINFLNKTKTHSSS